LAQNFIKYIKQPYYVFDLEDPTHLDQLSNPKTTLELLAHNDKLTRQNKKQPIPTLFLQRSLIL
jgi:hypothetical protein